MPWYIVGIDGDHTPDPAYWRDRWERIEAGSSQTAKQVWISMREGWLADNEIKHIFVDRISDQAIERMKGEHEGLPYFDRRIHKR